ncbi:fibronectin type III domain-containing protein [Rhodobacter sp. TJ_12]|uniref:fibronectin type III domain-containing protein n=1 Tax=Rhodobacter sp. TJ_12 TaxID=2029399 RepID=UPI001CBCD132|nr:fibronectin type III domain-containing protein [Rhodobacter sp. TJ_12]
MRKLIYAAILGTTCLSTSAQAGPVGAFLSGIWTGLSTGVVAGAGITGAWATGASIGAGLAAFGGTFLGRVLFSVGLSAIAQSLAPKPKVAPLEVMTNYAQDLSFVEMAYGEVRKGGAFALSAFSQDGAASEGMVAKARRHYGVILAAHPIEGVIAHYLYTWEVETDEAGVVTTDPINGRCKIRLYDGTQTAPDAIWDALFPEVTAADYYPGLAYAALYAERVADSEFSKVYPRGREWAYAPVLRGENRIYDPRTGTTGWTNNAALVIADVATRWYGKAVDWDEVAAQADISDAPVTNRDGGTQPRWTINTVLRTDMTWEDVRAHLTMCCDAFFYERTDGKLGFKVGHYEEPPLTLTDADFAAVSLKHKATGPDDVYSFAYRYVEPARDYAEEVTGAVVVGSNPAGGRSEQECYGITSHNQAWRCAYRWAKASKPEWRLSGTLKFIGRELMGHRFVRVQLSELGLDAVFEVATLARNAGSHSWSLEAVSVDAADFAPDALTLEPPRPVRATIAEDGTVPVPASLTGAVVEGTGGVAQIEWTWPAQTEDLKQRLRIRRDGGDWYELTMVAGQSSYLDTGLVDGATYEAQVRNVTVAGRLSDWAPEAPVSVDAVANTLPPGGFGYFSAMQSGSSVALSWTAPNDSHFAAARIYRATDSTDLGDASLVGLEYGAPNATDEWLDAAPGTGAHSYWIEPVNGSGIPGTVSGPQTVTIS